jgi:CRP/FNR family transcriptional regulator, cyclic AMP receptor protein
MISRDELKKIVMLGYLKDEMLDKLSPLVDVLNYSEREYVFRQGDAAERFYMLRRGKILFERRGSEKMSVTMGSVKPGYSFGWSSMVDVRFYSTDAVCAEPSEVFSVRGHKLQDLLESDHSMGYIFSQRLLRVIKSRLDHRTEQFMRVIRNHPDLKSLFEE